VYKLKKTLKIYEIDTFISSNKFFKVNTKQKLVENLTKTKLKETSIIMNKFCLKKIGLLSNNFSKRAKFPMKLKTYNKSKDFLKDVNSNEKNDNYAILLKFKFIFVNFFTSEKGKVFSITDLLIFVNFKKFIFHNKLLHDLLLIKETKVLLY